MTFHKGSDLFWEQRVGGSNPSAPTINLFPINKFDRVTEG